MNKILTICGPTATGKTALGIEAAKKFDGEIVSADSRQVYTGMDIITGKDIIPGSKPFLSTIKWRDRFLKYYIINGIKVWLYDIVNPDEPFNVAYWKEAAELVICDIHLRGKLPIVVGGTGLYVKSLFSTLDLVRIPPNNLLRKNLSSHNAEYLFNYLNKLDSIKAASLNNSDRKNPRRLIRAIEIATAPPSPPEKTDLKPQDILTLGLTAEKPYLFSRVTRRVAGRVVTGALAEIAKISAAYGSDVQALTALGYRAFSQDRDKGEEEWISLECQYIRRQLTWFKKQPGIIWFDISKTSWQETFWEVVQNWYNKNRNK
jgi:tRNA dimethylallyltransferase